MTAPPVEERGEHAPGDGRTRRLKPGQSAALLVLGAGALIGITFWRAGGEREQPATPEPVATVPPPAISADPVAVPAAAATPAPPPVPPPPALAAAAQTGTGTRGARLTSYAVPAQPAPAVPAPAKGGEDGEAARGGATSVAFQGQRIAGAKAGPALDTSLMLMPGIYTCVLDTAVSSERAGPFQCHTEEDIKSPQRVTLMPKWTVIQGTYQSDVRQGQARIASLAATAWTPDGIPVPLGAQVGDELGRMGMPGRVNRHLWERFGGAVTLLLSQGAIDLARSALQQGDGSSYVNLNTGGVQSLAAEVARATINIPNTVEKNQGERIAFFVAAPVSFEDAIRLRSR